MNYVFAISVGIAFLASFYCLFMLAHIMDWAVQTFSGGKQRLITDAD